MALLGVKAKAYASLSDLQESYEQNVEPKDAATLSDLAEFRAKEAEAGSAWSSNGQAENETSNLLVAQLSEITSGLSATTQTFENFASATAERTEIFSNFSGV